MGREDPVEFYIGFSWWELKIRAYIWLGGLLNLINFNRKKH